MSGTAAAAATNGHLTLARWSQTDLFGSAGNQKGKPKQSSRGLLSLAPAFLDEFLLNI